MISAGTVIGKYLSFVKFAHTIFALPFALIGFFMGYIAYSEANPADPFPWQILIYVILCMVFARSAAMGFNRYADRDIDAENVRTKVREIPAGKITPKNALAFVIINSLLFIATTWFINEICFYLSPVALAVVLGYSYTKRFTALCHLVLGLGLSLAPVGAYLAVAGEFALEPILLGVAVMTWVAGFDVIYAMQDVEFDRDHDLNSIPAFFGRKTALWISTTLHLATAGCIVAFGWISSGGTALWIGSVIFCMLLVYQHYLVKPNDLSKVNLAFFTTNGVASVVFAAFVIVDLLLNV